MVEVFWTDEEGCRWRVTDVVAETRKGKRVPWPVELGNSIARWRVFTDESTKARRVYRFREEQHGVTEPTLRRQFLEAEAIKQLEPPAKVPRPPMPDEHGTR
jgi:hypothetical protein